MAIFSFYGKVSQSGKAGHKIFDFLFGSKVIRMHVPKVETSLLPINTQVLSMLLLHSLSGVGASMQLWLLIRWAMSYNVFHNISPTRFWCKLFSLADSRLTWWTVMGHYFHTWGPLENKHCLVPVLQRLFSTLLFVLTLFFPLFWLINYCWWCSGD